MIGQKEIGKQTFKTKAAETRGVLSFTIWLVYEYMIDLGKHVDTYKLVRAGESLEVLMAIFRQHERPMGEEACKTCVALCEEHLDCVDALGLHVLPKHHLFQHLVDEIPELGNPRILFLNILVPGRWMRGSRCV